jgi:hypothetical protein
MRRILLFAMLMCLVPAGISYLVSMTGKSDSSLGVRSVEWLRDNGARGIVNSIENFYYSLNAPAKGGAALKTLPKVGVGSAATKSARTRAAVKAALALEPRPIPPVISPALPGEGVWSPAGTWVHGAPPPVLLTTFRSEAAYPRLVAGVAWIDTSRALVTLNAGISEPSVSLPSRGAEEVPLGLRSRLLATFNSGFKLVDSHGGWALGGHSYAPLHDGMATLIGYSDGHVDVRAWTGGPNVGSDVVFARQNLPLIVEGGRPNPNLSDGPAWGATLGNAIRVWRSGLGVDAHGNLLYAAANDQTVSTLAQILIRAGAVRAMQLDINNYWVSFITYAQRFAASPSNLLPDMVRPVTRYLSPDDRDFFAVYLRPGTAAQTLAAGSSAPG